MSESRSDPAQLGEVPTGEGTVFVDELFEIPARDVLHDDKRGLPSLEFSLPGVVNLHYVRVGKFGGGAPLAPKAGADVRLPEVGSEDLDGHGTVQDLVATQEDPGHATRADLALQNESLRKPDHADDYMSLSHGYLHPPRKSAVSQGKHENSTLAPDP